MLAQFGEAIAGECKGDGDCGRHAHHPDHGSSAEDEQIHRRPDWVVNSGQDKERHRRRPGKSVNETDDQRPQALIETESADRIVYPRFYSRHVFGRSPWAGLVGTHGNHWGQRICQLLHNSGKVQSS